jgi:hypothetical protein
MGELTESKSASSRRPELEAVAAWVASAPIRAEQESRPRGDWALRFWPLIRLAGPAGQLRSWDQIAMIHTSE